MATATAQVQPLLAAVRRILRPLVRVLLRHGVPYPVFSELARWTYADVAAQEFRVGRRKQTNSRISLLTGLSRKEVLRLRRLSPPGDEASVERFHRGARIVSTWVRDPEFQTEAGEPLALPFDGTGATFSKIVAEHGGDLPPRAVLDELQRVGTVERAEDGRIRLRERAYLPSGCQADEERIAILGIDVSALLSTIDHNLQTGPEGRFFQRKVEYRGLPSEDVPQIRALASSEAQSLLEMLDRRLARQLGPRSGDGTQPAGTKRLMLGIYWFEEDIEEP